MIHTHGIEHPAGLDSDYNDYYVQCLFLINSIAKIISSLLRLCDFTIIWMFSKKVYVARLIPASIRLILFFNTHPIFYRNDNPGAFIPEKLISSLLTR